MTKDSFIQLADIPYPTFNGEGIFQGIEMCFVRTMGCPVECDWCDTMYSWGQKSPVGITKPKEYSRKKIIDTLRFYVNTDIPIWWTGGEPTIYLKQISEIIKELGGIHHICTTGMIYDPVLFNAFDYVTLDLKAPSSKAKKLTKVEKNIEQIINQFQPYNPEKFKVTWEYPALRRSLVEIKIPIKPTKEDRQFALDTVQKYAEVDIPITIQPIFASELEYLSNGMHNTTQWKENAFHTVVHDLKTYNRNVRLGTQNHKMWDSQRQYDENIKDDHNE